MAAGQPADAVAAFLVQPPFAVPPPLQLPDISVLWKEDHPYFQNPHVGPRVAHT